MKQFFMSFLGTVAGIFVSGFLISIGLFILTVMAIVSSATHSEYSVKDKSILYLDLSREIVEQPASLDIMAKLTNDGPSADVLYNIIDAIDAAADDDRIKGIFIDANGSSAGTAQRKAIIDALRRFKKSGKWIYSYGDYYSQGDYYIAASTSDSLYINPLASVDIHGLGGRMMFFKNLLDKIGVEMQVVKVGTYKSAVEPFILTEPSAASIEQQQLYLGNLWKDIRASIAKGRKVSADSVNAWANSFSFTFDATQIIRKRIADASAYRHEFIDKLKELTDIDKDDDLRLVTPAQYITSKPHKSHKTTIAVLYASGDITESGKDGIASDRLVPEILELAENDDIDGLILRVNSGGGSAFASEQIWEALGEFKEMTGKPFYVSMSDYAASGGYYISCGADKIYAEPVTITGSIGIFGLIPNIRGLVTDKLGVTTYPISTNPAGAQPDIFAPMTESQRAGMQSYVDRGYELFVKRVAGGRKKTVEQIKAIAEGRVWDGREALRIGLVDKLGGLDTALADMARELGVESWSVERYPKTEDDVLTALLMMSDRMEQSALERKLGDVAEIYRTIESIRQYQGVQARMQPVVIE
ncbi:signal peptide peptidase SppA 67K type [Prevotella sp. CAG:1031]|nr:signal peptide peptidase SppA 67K type [Prevotella sp. CAG:1031]